MRLLDSTPAAPRDLDDAARAFEALALKQILAASGAFRGGSGPGASIHADLFVDTLAQELAKAGGLGLAEVVARTLGSHPTPAGSGAPGVGPGNGMAWRTVAPAPTVAQHLHEHDAIDLRSLTDGTGRITSAYGLRTDPLDGSLRHHRGVDIGAPEGTPILAVADGVVRFSGDRGGYGKTVEIDHGNGVTTLYAHAAELHVEEGSLVTRGQAIGTVGSTGRATGAHLHFEVRVDDRPVSPTRALKAYGIGAE